MTVTLSDLLRQDYRERITLIELDYVAEEAGAPVTRTLYFSNSVRVTQGRFLITAGADSDSPTGPPVIYEDCINSVPNFTRSISGPIGSTFSSSLGSIEIDNADGDKDFILALALDGSQVRFYVFDSGIKYLIFTAIALRTSAPSFDRISIVLKDSGVLLNKSVGGEDVIGGVGPNADRWRPVNFGYVHNLEALVLDSSTLTYVHSDTGTFTSAVDVRDKGVSVTYTDNADGTFTLDASPAGIITCDVVATYDGTDPTRRVSDFLQFLVADRQSNNQGQGFAGAGPTFTIGDDDDYLIGISIPDARNIVDVLNQVCDSGNCFWAIKRTGEFTYGRLRPNDISVFGFVAATITEDDYDQGSWKIDHDPPLYYLLQAYMSRNWSRQQDFAGSLTPDEQAVYTRPGIFLLQDTAVGTAYADIPEAYDKTLSISPALDTLLSGGFDELDLPYLAAWMETRRFMQLPWIERLSMTVGLEFYFLELGDPVEVITPRYGLDGGDLFQVISININLTRSKIDLVLLRRHVAEPLPPGWQRVTASIDFVPPPLALRPFINPPPGPGADSPMRCGWIYDPARGWYFVPCGGGGGGSNSYIFRIGGITYGTVADPSQFFQTDITNVPAFYDFSGQNILVHEDVVDAASGGLGGTVTIIFTPEVRDLAYPASIFDSSGISIIEFDDASTHAADDSIIDYTVNVSSVFGLQVAVPAGPYSPGTDLTLGTFNMDIWTDYDPQPGTVCIATDLLAPNNAYLVNAGLLIVTIQNDSGSTLTTLDDGGGSPITINLPSNAADPDAPVDGELDVSFAGATTAVCTINNATGATVTVGGTRHQLTLKVTGASILDGTTARFVFPIQFFKGGDDGWIGVTNTGSSFDYPIATFQGPIAVTPSATVMLFTDCSHLVFLPNN